MSYSHNEYILRFNFMKIGPHYIRANKASSIPKRIVFFDTETYAKETKEGNFEQSFRLGTAIYQRRRDNDKAPQIQNFETKDQDELCKWILGKVAKKERLFIISSNIWFDIRVSGILTHLWHDRWINKRLYAKGMTLIISFRKDDKTIVFLNLQNFFRSSIETLGESIDLPKLDIDFEKSDDDDLMTYCWRDTEILCSIMNLLFKFLRDKDLGNFSMTFPSIAFNIFRHKHMKQKMLVHQDKEVIELERKAYFGGRVECFKLGKFAGKSFLKIDINSMYPYLMREYLYPIVLKGMCKNVSLSTLEIFLDGYCVCAHVKLDTNEPVYVVKQQNRSIFPIGQFDAYLSSPCLLYALEHGHIKQVYEMALYRKAFVFKDYVNFFYNLRLKYTKQGNKPFESLCKYLLNSLYGKFGQKADLTLSEVSCDYNLTERVDYYNVETNRRCVNTKFFGRSVTLEEGAGEGINSIVAIAAHVCEYGRLMLWKAIKKIGVKNVYYCDTDCIIFDMAGIDLSLLTVDPTKLGAFKFEAKSGSIVIKGLKDYSFAGETKIKGISKKALQLKPDEYQQTYFPGIYSELRKGLTKPYTIQTQIKKLKRKYTKGNVAECGDVSPIILP